MKILITGRSGLAQALSEVYFDHATTLVSRSNGHDINMIRSWGSKFLDHDMVFNCAYDGLAQIAVLEFFHQYWQKDKSKIIINIGSRVITFPRTETTQQYWSYKVHKQALQATYEQMLPGCLCDIKFINPGPIDTDMVRHLDTEKFDPLDLAQSIKQFAQDPTIKRVDLWV